MAREVFETVNNDSFATATPLGRAENDSFVRGSLFATDRFDVYKFTVDRPAKFAAGMSLQGVDADLGLFNSQGQLIKFSSNVGTSGAEIINVENLSVGEYFLSVNKVSGDGTYNLTTNGDAIARAQLSITVDRVTALDSFDTGFPGTRVGEADFQIDIGGQKSGKFTDRNDIRPNFTVSQTVDINSRFPGTVMTVRDIDTIGTDLADINPQSGVSSLGISFDAAKGEALNPSFIFRAGENQVVTLQGNGGGDGRARVQFRVNYDTFSSSVSSTNGNTPIIQGNNRSQTLIGQNQGGILCGEGGNDDLSGMGGNDILCGGAGNDKLNGGTGKDISFGGAGRDVHHGGAGSDTFVLSPNSGVDVIRDFQNGVDKLGLVMGVGFEMLEIAQQGKNTVIGAGSQRLAVLANVRANQITAADFVTVDFTHFRGVEVPTIVA